MLFIFPTIRPPNDVNWRKLWDTALAKEACSNGIFVCSNHFAPHDIKQTSKRYMLNKNAVPSIFAQFFVDENHLQLDNDSEPEMIDAFRCISLCHKCPQLIRQIQCLQRKLSEINEKMSTIEELYQIITSQSNQIKKLTLEVNTIKEKTRSDFAQFVLEPSDPKVRF